MDEGRGVGPSGEAVFLDFADAIKRLGKDAIAEKYGNLFDMYAKITDENPYEQPMRMYPAVHYTMGGLWVDYNLQSTIPGLHVLGEANFSDHGANRLGASALMQGLADGYFVIPYTIGHYLASNKLEKVDTNHEAFKPHAKKCPRASTNFSTLRANVPSTRSTKSSATLCGEYVGMSRSAPGSKQQSIKFADCGAEFWKNVAVTGEPNFKNAELEKAGRVADFLELGELMAKDALERNESCGGHFREEYQTPDNEAQRDDANFSHATAWEFADGSSEPSWKEHREILTFEYVKPSQRSYK